MARPANDLMWRDCKRWDGIPAFNFSKDSAKLTNGSSPKASEQPVAGSAMLIPQSSNPGVPLIGGDVLSRQRRSKQFQRTLQLLGLRRISRVKGHGVTSQVISERGLPPSHTYPGPWK